jgi:hypothetical protein
METLIDAVVAIGTLAVAIIAIWGDRLRAWLAPAKLVIECVDTNPSLGQLAIFEPPKLPSGMMIATDPNAPTRAMWYNLKVVNKRPWMASRNCRVLLKAISRRGPDGQYHLEKFAVPRQFWWAPSESTPAEITLVREHVFDFGQIGDRADNEFVPTIFGIPANFPGFVGIKESLRYSLEIVADNFVSPRYQVFEVSWDGLWDEHPETMARHLTIREIKDSTIVP